MNANKTETYTFTVPKDSAHEDAGKEIEKTFEYSECQDEAEALTVIREKKWSVLDMVNKALKANARSSAYQSAVAVYKPSEMTPDEAKERMIRAFVRQGVSETVARAQVEALLGTVGQ